MRRRRFRALASLLLISALSHFLSLSAFAQSMIVVRGIVVSTDTSGTAPIADALLVLPSLDRSVRTDSTGRFQFRALRQESLSIRVSRLGYRPLEFDVALGSDSLVDLEITLERLPQAMPEVRISTPSRRLEQFVERRRRGIGTFLDSTAIARRARDGRFVTALRETPGVRLARSRTSAAQFLVAGREARPWSGSGPCYAAVVLDGAWVFRGGPGVAPFDINSVLASAVLAAEYYRSTAQVPAELAGPGSECGVLVLYTK
jgi:hypothetical protein